MPWIGLGIVEWNPCCYGCSLLSISDTAYSFLSLSQKHDWPYVLGTLWTYRALRYLHFESTRHFSVREIFE